jgi:hypothetical protein
MAQDLRLGISERMADIRPMTEDLNWRLRNLSQN